MAKKKGNNKRQINGNYKSQLDRAKEAYKKSNGLKVARGFNKSKEYKRIERNRKQTIRRFEKRIVQDFTNDPQPQNPVVKDFLVLDQSESFYNVLSYGGKADKFAMVQFRSEKNVHDKKFKAVLDFRKLGLGHSTHYDQFSFDSKMKWIYKRLLKMQDKNIIGSMATVTTSIGTVDGMETLLVQLD